MRKIDTMTKVYLAGGLKSNWQEKVTSSIKELMFHNPRDKEYNGGVKIDMPLIEYGIWDIHHIKQSDIVFVYVEATNTSCIGLSVEAGYAKGLGKTVITVLETNHETIPDYYLSFIRLVSDVVFDTLDEGIEYLRLFV